MGDPREQGGRSGLAHFLVRLWREKPLGAIGGVVVLALILVAIFADVLAPYPVDEVHLRDLLKPPSAEHLMGTDQLGRDLLSRNIHGARVSMFVGLLQLILVLGVSGGVVASRLVRGAVIAVKENDYLQAATATGSTRMGALVRHVLPNVAAPIIVVFSINIGAVIISEASLSFLGFGLSPEIPSWGTLLSRDGRKYMEQAPWLALWPGLCLTLTVYSLNMFGDAVRDLLDPRLRGGGGRLGTHRGRTGRAQTRSGRGRSHR